MALVPFRQSDSRIERQAGGAISEVNNRWQDGSRLDRSGLRVKLPRTPDFFSVPWPAIIEVLKVHSPARVTVLNHIHQPCLVTTVTVVVAGEEISVVVKRQLLGIA